MADAGDALFRLQCFICAMRPVSTRRLRLVFAVDGQCQYARLDFGELCHNRRTHVVFDGKPGLRGIRLFDGNRHFRDRLAIDFVDLDAAHFSIAVQRLVFVEQNRICYV